MSAADDRAEAETNITLALASEQGYLHLSPADLIALAQVNATLALVEQQRIANAIAAASDPSGFLAQNLDDIRMGLAGDVWEGIGL